MVTTKDGDSVLIADFKSDQKGNCLNWIVPTIDVVAHEQVICVRRAAANPEELHKVMELAVDIAAYSDWTFNFGHIWLFGKDIFRLINITILKSIRKYISQCY